MTTSEFYYNVDTGQVEEGHQSPGASLMGPYSSREQAQGALKGAQERNQAWDRQDQEWDED
ncbi:hypothetical protein DEO23_10505 [Brachybacterium endophyticum]|uniref:SPOR domain-containing protein n=1 Tax=Brachybacterium endophyticum TaxID=2182385 RepID=A0A2U2RIF8_9MICO|nr:hypothetical protein [Brachybacterium endophyticum]PWH05640.1 hypothetical protein DEO23_10505 [Brachybacterium endophyticum]